MDPTAVRSSGPGFETTHWSEIAAARTATPERRQVVLNNLLRRYWRPVYYYLRAKGWPDADARDLTQGFFVDIVLGRDLFGRVQPGNGRFRACLLHCLKNYLRDHQRRERARRRMPDIQLVSLDQWADAEADQFFPAAVDGSPEQVFHRKWAASLLRNVLDRLAQECTKCGQSVHWAVFEERVLRPTLEDTAPMSPEELGHRYALSSRQVNNRVETVRRRFRRMLLEDVRLTLADESTAEDEVHELMAMLTGQAV